MGGRMQWDESGNPTSECLHETVSGNYLNGLAVVVGQFRDSSWHLHLNSEVQQPMCSRMDLIIFLRGTQLYSPQTTLRGAVTPNYRQGGSHSKLPSEGQSLLITLKKGKSLCLTLKKDSQFIILSKGIVNLYYPQKKKAIYITLKKDSHLTGRVITHYRHGENHFIIPSKRTITLYYSQQGQSLQITLKGTVIYITLKRHSLFILPSERTVTLYYPQKRQFSRLPSRGQSFYLTHKRDQSRTPHYPQRDSNVLHITLRGTVPSHC